MEVVIQKGVVRVEKFKKGIILFLLIGAGGVVIAYTILTVLAIIYGGEGAA